MCGANPHDPYHMHFDRNIYDVSTWFAASQRVARPFFVFCYVASQRKCCQSTLGTKLALMRPEQKGLVQGTQPQVACRFSPRSTPSFLCLLLCCITINMLSKHPGDEAGAKGSHARNVATSGLTSNVPQFPLPTEVSHESATFRTLLGASRYHPTQDEKYQSFKVLTNARNCLMQHPLNMGAHASLLDVVVHIERCFSLQTRQPRSCSALYGATLAESLVNNSKQTQNPVHAWHHRLPIMYHPSSSHRTPVAFDFVVVSVDDAKVIRRGKLWKVVTNHTNAVDLRERLAKAGSSESEARWITSHFQHSTEPPCYAQSGEVAMLVDTFVTYNVYHYFANFWFPYMLLVMSLEHVAGGRSFITPWFMHIMRRPAEQNVKWPVYEIAGLLDFFSSHFDKSNVTKLDAKQNGCYRKVVVAQPISLLNLPSPNIFNVCFSSILRGLTDWMQHRVGISIAVSPRKYPRLGWLQRAGRPTRARIHNQAALVDKLMRECIPPCAEVRQLNFSASFSAVKQCQSVSEVDILVGVHGAGMTWQVCLPYQSGIVVVGPFADTLFSSIGNSLGHVVSVFADRSEQPSPNALWHQVQSVIQQWMKIHDTTP